MAHLPLAKYVPCFNIHLFEVTHTQPSVVGVNGDNYGETYGVANVGKAMGDIGGIGEDTIQEQNDYCL